MKANREEAPAKSDGGWRQPEGEEEEEEEEEGGTQIGNTAVRRSAMKPSPATPLQCILDVS